MVTCKCFCTVRVCPNSMFSRVGINCLTLFYPLYCVLSSDILVCVACAVTVQNQMTTIVYTLVVLMRVLRKVALIMMRSAFASSVLTENWQLAHILNTLIYKKKLEVPVQIHTARDCALTTEIWALRSRVLVSVVNCYFAFTLSW